MDVVIGLGANLGDRRATLVSAVRALSTLGRVAAISSLYETLAVDAPGPDFLNAAARLDVRADPVALLVALLEVERAHGRERRERFGPRTLDLDVLWIRERVVTEPGLAVPHARLLERRFALAPLLDVAPDAHDPRTGRSLAAHLSALPESGVVLFAGSGWVPAFQATPLSG
jgi:2-amino-4-hydroxy-6-hydroxymethyldihydropteridine diphosphokinase